MLISGPWRTVHLMMRSCRRFSQQCPHADVFSSRYCYFPLSFMLPFSLSRCSPSYLSC